MTVGAARERRRTAASDPATTREVDMVVAYRPTVERDDVSVWVKPG